QLGPSIVPHQALVESYPRRSTDGNPAAPVPAGSDAADRYLHRRIVGVDAVLLVALCYQVPHADIVHVVQRNAGLQTCLSGMVTSRIAAGFDAEVNVTQHH